MQNKIITSTCAKVRLNVLSCEKEIKGIVYSPYYGKKVRIESLKEFIEVMENLFDSLGLPEKSMEFRRFSFSEEKKAKNIQKEEEKENREGIANFEIDVKFRKNTDWQGELIWLEKERKKEFSSVMELILLIENAVKKLSDKKSWKN